MANSLPNIVPSIFIFSTIFFFFYFSTPSTAQNDTVFATTLSPENFGNRPLILTHLHFYFHDIIDGPNQTTVRVAGANLTSKFSLPFGDVAVIDDPLTLGPDLNSKIVGRAQGIYASASKSELSLLMVLNYVFFEGKYNGSTLSILGRNSVNSSVRELPIVGGSGVFRFARGYALAKTYKFDTNSSDAIVEYNVYVYH
ncbi:dirigent protein 21-like [Ziziphus jujuba]|uniref:Dirigent protein n=1 Tax=Ziziphus jujuba TaxID=326968 RepID=A0ABM3I780_ZIZJJ|nr:dirigent protein 21-like [Ziziphus jujuba]